MSRLCYVLGAILLATSVAPLPVQDEGETADGDDTTTETVPSNETQNLYVIKSVVYEIGILTDGDDDSASNETHEQIDVSFFDPGHNGSLIDLSSIPIPIQTNVSGVAVTGILPADLGSISLNDDGTATYNGSAFPLLPNKQVRITHNISTVNRDKSSSILSGLPQILGLDNLIKPDKEKNSTTAEPEDREVADDDEGSETADEKDLRVDGLVDDEDEGISS